MEGFKKYYKKSWSERLEILKKQEILSQEDIDRLKSQAIDVSLGETQIENFITQYLLPEGLALNYVINGKEYLIPMVTEEPSVIAASSHGAGIVKKSGGFKASVKQRLMLGQVIVEKIEDVDKFEDDILENEAELLEIANQAHPSIVRRGGGARWIRVRKLDKSIVSIDLAVDVQEAMGANMLNTMLEAIAATIREKYEQDVVMSILSNYATECLATAICDIPVASLTKNGMSGEKIAEKIAQASYIAQIDPYRATTHNKGIMNGIDGVVIASGNDWRAIEAGAHAYAAKDCNYRGLSTWKVIGDTLHGEITLPLPLGSVGGSIGIVPLVKVNHKLLEIENAIELEKVVASVGLGQNLAALYALVTEGIQKGHMRLQLKSLASSIGATEKEIPLVVSKLEKLNKRDMSTAKEILDNLRNEGK